LELPKEKKMRKEEGGAKKKGKHSYLSPQPFSNKTNQKGKKREKRERELELKPSRPMSPNIPHLSI
jgi:hypothetical protein